MTEREIAADQPRRLGDAIAIPGDYQHRALLDGPPVQRYWHTAKLELLEWFARPNPRDRSLDVGCGSGVFADAMARAGADVLGVDANPDAVTYAEKTFAREGLAFARGYLDELALPPSSFDFASSLEVVEHVYPPQIRALLADLHRILRPGGRLLITTPNYRGLWPVVEWLADRSSKTAHMDADQHVTHLHRRMLRRFLTEAGFEVLRLRTYCTFAPFAAGVAWKLAAGLDRIERRIDLPFGNLLAAEARRPTTS